ncbi:helix-turn-helix domain-containing protein [Streptomyces sp. E-15]
MYMLERAADAHAAKHARGLPTGRPAKLNATSRAGAAQRIKSGAIPEQVAAELGVSRSTLYRELRKHREPPNPSPSKADQRARPPSLLVPAHPYHRIRRFVRAPRPGRPRRVHRRNTPADRAGPVAPRGARDRTGMPSRAGDLL